MRWYNNMEYDKLKKYIVSFRATSKNVINKPIVEITEIIKNSFLPQKKARQEGKEDKKQIRQIKNK